MYSIGFTLSYQSEYISMHLVHVLMTYTPHFKDIEVVRGRLLAQWAKNVILNFFHNVLQVSIHRKKIKVSEIV